MHGRPGEAEALKAFLDFVDGRILVAHNAHSFDIRFLRAAAKRSGIEFEPTYIDTLTMAQAMYPGLHNYKQGTINKHLELPPTRPIAPARTLPHWAASSASC